MNADGHAVNRSGSQGSSEPRPITLSLGGVTAMATRRNWCVTYTGELARPIRAKDCSNVDKVIETLQSRLPALAEFHGVNLEAHNAIPSLLFALIQAHVPGFRIQKPPGRPRTWEDGLGEAWRIEVEETKQRLNCSIRAAIEHLRAEKGTPWSAKSEENLEPRYRDADRRYRSASPRDRIVLALMARKAVPRCPSETD